MEKSCIFYSSKSHLCLILLEFLKNRNIKKYTIKTFLQNPIEHEILNLKKIYKTENIEINNIDFNKTNEISLKKIDSDNRKQLIIIEGSRDYINKACKYIEETSYNKRNIRIVCCCNYEMEKQDILQVLKNSNSIITTTGEKHLTNYY